jgi:hypothetical protein
MTRRAEFVPIYIQLRKTDEVGEFASTLTSLQALEYLENQSVKLFQAPLCGSALRPTARIFDQGGRRSSNGGDDWSFNSNIQPVGSDPTG